MSGRPLLGVVLAGGESRRFGRPKSEAQLGRLTLMERARRTLRPLCDEVRVSGPTDLPDPRPDSGPLGGIEGALQQGAARGGDGVVVLACDLVAIHSATLGRLIERWRATPDPRSAVVAPDFPLQPLAAVWGVDTLAAVQAALDDDRGSVRDVARDLAGFVGVAAEELAEEVGLAASELLHNVNRPDDLAAARSLVLPPIVTVLGWKNSGKTTVATALIAALGARGIDAVAAKHGHGFRFEPEGTDSRRFREEGGARKVIVAGPDEMAVFSRWRGAEPGLGGLVRRWAPEAEVVVAEGWKSGPWPAIEVRAPGGAAEQLHIADAPDARRYLAVVSGGRDRPDPPLHLDRDSPTLGDDLADLIERRLLR